MRGAGRYLGVLAVVTLLAAGAAGAPAADRHEIKWFVHTDLVTPSENLAFYEAMLDAALEDALLDLEGHQGPVDTVCCEKLDKEAHSGGATLQSFGTQGDGLDVVDGSDFDTLRGIGLPGSRGFIVDSILNCGGFAAIGCADLPFCNFSYDDDPNLILVVTRDAQDFGVLGLTIAHERGHNACLEHVGGNTCQLMQATVAGGCLSPSECSSYGTARQQSAGSCACHAGSSMGTPESDETLCTDGPISGLCSGGVCGETPGHASVRLLAAGGPEGASGASPDDLLSVSTLTGGWTVVGGFGAPPVPLRGLEYSPDAQTLYGIQETAGNERLATVDPSTGAILTSLEISGRDKVIALAFDPGATSDSEDDRLLALDSDGSFEDLIQIDPITGNATLLGSLNVGVFGNFQGLAFDSTRDRLYAAGAGTSGIYEIDESSCDPPFAYCNTTAVPDIPPREDASLTYSVLSDSLYRVSRIGGRTYFDAIAAAPPLVAGTSIGIDPYTPGALAALPLPEPSANAALAAGVALLLGLARRRRAGQ